ncbi:MAG: Gfo/Idh/MocA family oxidoreductase, partial [Phyllobacteriaceae bacterium]|nr:Gfo/Idh/MocA family oxidoreductase [Phyllobacteriaceae bacterium]
MNGWAQIPGVHIEGVCDIDPAKAEAFAQDFGARPFTDARHMLEQLQPDFVDIATTVHSHRALVELAAPATRLVICQKPLAEHMADARAMVMACENAGTHFIVHENFRWQRPFRELRKAIDKGAIGQPHFLRLSFSHDFDIYANQPYLADVADLALTDIGLHMFDLVRFLMGDVESVACHARRLNPNIRGLDAFTALLVHGAGAASSVECSFFSTWTPEP